jgi:hypothetical protein
MRNTTATPVLALNISRITAIASGSTHLDRRLSASLNERHRVPYSQLRLPNAVRYVEGMAIMVEEDGHEIPAANIGDTDLVALAQTNPGAAEEIKRLVALMDRGEESKEEFLQLCQLLFDVGSVAASEHLLRRNLDFYEGHALYVQLFGTTRQDEFDTAIEAFKRQFKLEMVHLVVREFLVWTFRSDGGTPRSDAFALLSRPCEITFSYAEQDKIEADVTLLGPWQEVFGPDEWMQLFFVSGAWKLVDPMDT